jgi:hypothetical protein
MSTPSIALNQSGSRLSRPGAAIIAGLVLAIALAVTLFVVNNTTTVHHGAPTVNAPKTVVNASQAAGLPAGYVRDPATHQLLAVTSPAQNRGITHPTNAFGGNR